jgi:outer membrane biosynthesis protein TonB
MAFLDTQYKKKSALLTTLIMLSILFLIFHWGMKYYDPPLEYGIAVNFGTSNVGSGNIQPTEPLKSASPIETVKETKQEEVQKVVEPSEASTPASASEDVATQDNEESIRINKQKEAQRKIDEARKRAKEAETKKILEAERVEKQRKAAVAKKQAEEKAKKDKLDAMMGGLNNSDGNASGGEGNDDQAGDKGNLNGDPNASGYYGNGGGGSGGNYRLGNRKAVSKPKPTYDCNEQGRVVVNISVDKNGRVISAEAGIKGTTNSAPCLLTRAKEAALKTKFNADNKAPSKQVGSIIYNFSLSN